MPNPSGVVASSDTNQHEPSIADPRSLGLFADFSALSVDCERRVGIARETLRVCDCLTRRRGGAEVNRRSAISRPFCRFQRSFSRLRAKGTTVGRETLRGTDMILTAHGNRRVLCTSVKITSGSVREAADRAIPARKSMGTCQDLSARYDGISARFRQL